MSIRNILKFFSKCLSIFFSKNYVKSLQLFQARVQRCRNNFVSTIESYDCLRDKMTADYSQDPGAFNPMYTRQGYLYVQTKNKSVPFNVVGSQWTKHYCQYQAKSKTLSMIPYTQLNGKITTSETVRVTSCLCKSEDSAEKFRFVVHGDELTQVRNFTKKTIFTFFFVPRSKPDHHLR